MRSSNRSVLAVLSLSLAFVGACSKDAPKSDPAVTTTVASAAASGATSAAAPGTAMAATANGEVTVGKPPPDG